MRRVAILTTDELEEFFETKQALNANHLAKEYGFEYRLVNNYQELEASLNDFYSDSAVPKILEIESKSADNANILSQIKARINSELTA